MRPGSNMHDTTAALIETEKTRRMTRHNNSGKEVKILYLEAFRGAEKKSESERGEMRTQCIMECPPSNLSL